METRDKFVMSVAFSPNNEWLASGGLDGLVNIFDVKVCLANSNCAACLAFDALCSLYFAL